MSFKAWPFLVSRNLYLDYRTVVAPDFICNAQISNLLARATDGDLTDAGTAICRKITGSSVGDLTLIFQIIKGTKADIQCADETTILKDPFGREIYLIEGLVFHEILDNVAINHQAISAAHNQVREAYSEFWEITDPSPAKASTAFDLNDFIVSEQPLILKTVEPFQVKQSLQHSANYGQLSIKDSLKTEFPISSIAFSPDGKCLVSRFDNQTIQQWDLDNLNKPELLQKTSSHSFASNVVFSPDGNFIASGTYLNNRNSVWLWNNSQNKQQKPLNERAYFESDMEPGTVLALVFSPDGQTLVAGSKYKRLIVWDMLSYKKTILAENLSEVTTIAFSPNGEVLFSGEKDGIVKIWYPKKRIEGRTLVDNLSPINSIACSPDGKLLAIGCDKSLEVWDLTHETNIYSSTELGSINSVAFSPDSQVIAIGSKDGKVSIWDIKKQRNIFNFNQESEIRTIVFSSKNNLLGSCSQDGIIKIWQY
ncbi:WD40 repeat domain-containing protein [Calothrix sp. NIES-2098]|uniref:WD40 repeat domain-containing protein n=1 Tax=Calothrix sp. NIES-2098 TaxID=1954171 RepID=UPI000B60E451|nr:WD-40 repeat protein [Calothrix sp. NIES-2098]